MLTTFGVAVVIKLCQNDDDCRFYARLWRMPGKSIASSSYACLRKDSVSLLDSKIIYYNVTSFCEP